MSNLEPLKRTHLNCTWAEQRTLLDAPLWLGAPASRWYCLARSEGACRLVDVEPHRCEACPSWHPRAELIG